jgi:protein TonB
MNAAPLQRTPVHVAGFGIVAGMHLLLGWALVSGLQHKVMDVIKGPIETRIIEEPKPPPPELPAQPLEFAAPPPPSFVPPPEVRVAPPPTPAPAISVITTVSPPAPAVIAPVLPAAPAAPPAQVALATPPAPAAPAPPSRTAPSLVFNGCEKPTYDAATTRAGVTGTVVVGYAMDIHGNISEARIERSAGASREHKMLDRLTMAAVTRCRGRPGTIDGKPEMLRGSVEYEWRLD